MNVARLAGRVERSARPLPQVCASSMSLNATVCAFEIGEEIMPVSRHIKAKNRDVLVLVGTMKGAFIFRSNRSRRSWDVGGPYFPGSAVYAMAYDGRSGRHRLWAAPNSMHWGGLLRSSDDF